MAYPVAHKGEQIDPHSPAEGVVPVGVEEQKAEEPAEEVKAAPKVSASMKKDELLAVAKEMGVEVDAKATKADIIAAIEAK